MLRRFRLPTVAIALVSSLALTACGSSGNSAEGAGQGSGNGDLGSQTTITLVGDSYNSATASMHVLGQGLEKAGYTVKYKQVDVGTMFAGVADGSGDASVAIWLPTTHSSYWDKYGDSIVKAGKVMDTVPLGFTVPDYMKIDSIEDLKGNTELGKKLNWTITGISPSAGEMQHAKKALKAYGLDKWKLQSSSGGGMVAALTSAEKRQEPIIVTLWYPHWAFVKWDLHILKDPKNIFGDPDDVYAGTRKGLKDDAPLAYQIISNFNWTKAQDEAVMLSHREGKDQDKSWDDVAKSFIQKNPDVMKNMLKGTGVQA